MDPPEHAGPSDAELVERITAGDAAAFEALHARSRDWAFAVARRHLGDRDAALDVSQDAFLWLLRRFPGFELRAPMKAVLFPVIRLLARDLRAKAPYRRTGSLASDPEGESRPPAADGELAEALDVILSELSEDARETVLLRYVDELSIAHVAAATGVPAGTVKSRLHHARAALRRDPRTRDLLEG